MNLGSIYGCFDDIDRNIIISAMEFHKVAITKGVRIKNWKTPTHNTICFLDAHRVHQALCYDLHDTNYCESYPDYMKSRIKKIKRLIKLIDSILSRKPR